MPQPSPTAPSLSEQASRLSLIDKAVARRIDEARELEGRLEKRVEFLLKAEENLKSLLENLRRHAADLGPIVSQIPQLRDSAASVVGDMVQQARVQTAQLMQPVHDQIVETSTRCQEQLLEAGDGLKRRLDQELGHDLGQRLAAHQQALSAAADEMVASATERLHEAAGAVEADLLATAQTLSSHIDAEMVTVHEQADDLMQQMRRQIREARDVSAEMSEGMEAHLQQALDRARAQAQTLTDPVRRQLNDDLRGYESRLEEIQSTAKAAVGEKMQALERTMAQGVAQMQQQLASAEQQVQMQTQQAVAAVKRSTQEQVAQLAQETKLEIHPILRRIADARDAFEGQVEGMMQAVEASLHSRMIELRGTGERTVDLVEEQLIGRLRGLRPQAQAMLDQTQEAIEARVAALLDTANHRIEQGESQLVMKIEDLRPRAAALVRDVDNEVQRQLRRWEQEAKTLTQALERRLGERVEELVDSSRSKLGGEIGKIDDAAAKLARMRLRGGGERAETPEAVSVSINTPAAEPARLSA